MIWIKMFCVRSRAGAISRMYAGCNGRAWGSANYYMQGWIK